MRKKHIIMIIMVFAFSVFGLAGCGENPEEIQTEYLGMLEEPASEESIEDLAAYLDKNLKYMDEENADHMVLEYEGYVLAYDSSLLNYNDLGARYGENISEALLTFYQLKSSEQENPFVVDATLQISWEELCSRAIAAEQFIKEYSDTESIKHDATWFYSNYINAILMGTTNTPTFDYETGVFSQDALLAICDVAAEYPDSTVKWTINEYMSYLEGIRYKLEYDNPEASKVFYDTCSYLVSEAGKRVYQ